MVNLNKDVLYLVFKELQDDKETLLSSLSVNKTWCEIIIPILWKNPWKYLKKGKEKLLLNVIISHLSDESRNNLSQFIYVLTNSYQRPLFNYISFCRHLNLSELQKIINEAYYYIHEKSKILIIRNEIISFLISENTKFTHLYIPQQFDYQIHLIPGAEFCFSEIRYLSCNASINDNVLAGLIEICKPIRELELFIGYSNNNYGIIKLIETPKKLFNIYFLNNYSNFSKPESLYKILENSMIKHSNTIESFKITKQPVTKVLSSFVNLKRLELCDSHYMTWNCLENLYLPFLQILKASRIPIKPLAGLIENTNGYLIEISIDCISHDVINNKRIIQVIYQNCPNLVYLKLVLRDSNILELEKLLINCQYLNGLYILNNDITFDFDSFFKTLTKSSPINLFKFKFDFYYRTIKSESLKLFFDNWKGRYPMYPMLLQLGQMGNIGSFIEKYKAEGIVQTYNYLYQHNLYDKDFVWI